MRRLFLLLLLTLPAQAQVTLSQTSDRVHIEINGQPYSDFIYGPDAPKPYLYPLRAADGTIVTRRFPMEKVVGETTSDQHHRSLWLGYKLVNGYDYWENEFSYHNPKSGKAVTQSVEVVKPGTIVAKILWLSPTGEPQIEEQRRMTISAPGKLRVIDCDISLKAIVKTTFGDSKDGAFSVRVAESMSERNGGRITNSEGAHNMAQAWGKPANWVDYTGEVEGEKVGIAVFDHPSSFHHPARWHVRDYGLLAANPFGTNAFDKSLPVKESVIEPGQAIHLRYRVIVHPAMSQQEIEALYAKFAGN